MAATTATPNRTILHTSIAGRDWVRPSSRALPMVQQLADAALPELEAHVGMTARDDEYSRGLLAMQQESTWKKLEEPTRSKFQRELRQRIDREHDDRACESLYRVGSLVNDIEPMLRAEMEANQEPPPAIAVYVATQSIKSEPNIPRSDRIQLEIADELRVARVSRELSTLTPSAMLAQYEKALAVTNTDTNAIIRVIEAWHYPNWTGVLPTSADTNELTAVNRLHRRIKQARESRVPEDLKEARKILDRASRLMQKAGNPGLRGWVPKRPKE
jgi:hypothetical protein